MIKFKGWLAVMKLCDTKEDFRKNFAKVFKKSAISEQMSFGWDAL
jgi:hypothetical protein